MIRGRNGLDQLRHAKNRDHPRRWEKEAVLDRAQTRLDRNPGMMQVRRETVEHPFGTIKAWMGATPLRDENA